MSSSNQAISDVSKSVGKFFTNTFTSVQISGPPLDPGHIQKFPLMMVSTHRSHIDYFLIGYNFFKMGFRNMRFAAGDNLTNLPYIGPRFMSWGAFPVERDNGFERNYVRNLCKSVMNMMEQRQAIILFPEGGRSYSGAMLELKNGILGAAVLAQARNLMDDVYILPISISYEFPPDLPYFGMLLNGKRFRKRGNNLLKRLAGNVFYFGADFLAYALALSAKWRGKKYGAVYLDYQDPVSIRDIVDIKNNMAQKARDEFSSHRVSMQQVGGIIYQKFLNLYRILPIHIVSSVLKGQESVSMEQAIAVVPPLIDDLRKKSRNIKQIESLEPLKIIEQGIEQLLLLKAVRFSGNRIFVRKQAIVNYYIALVESVR